MDRYWVGGSGSWNSTSKWSATSGGASGASVPTASDNAIFDANSAAAHYTVTVTDNATCADLTFTPEPAGWCHAVFCWQQLRHRWHVLDLWHSGQPPRVVPFFDLWPDP
jgi:hypothetical protein